MAGERKNLLGVLQKIIEIKVLERDLGNYDNPFTSLVPAINTDNLGKRGFDEGEIKDFVDGYNNFAREKLSSLASQVILKNLQELYNQNKTVLEGTIEERYVQELIENVGKKSVNRIDPNYDLEISDLDLSIRVHNCLQNNSKYKIRYVGDLVQITEQELSRTSDSFGRKSLNEVKKELGKRGLHLGMDINYVAPEERSKR